MEFDEKNASGEQLWQFYMGKYQNPNPIARYLTDRFYRDISALVNGLPADSRILEVGCGPGESTHRLLDATDGRTLESSEFEQRLVDFHLDKGFPVPLRQESVYELQREDNSFDCVMLLEVLEHLEDPQLALKEIFRVAARDVIISVPNEPLWRILNFLRGKYWSDWGNTPGHINHWSRASLVQLVSRYGTVQQVFSPTPWTIVHARTR